MKTKFKLDQIEHAVKTYILPLLDDRTILTFTGPLGAGKTTLIKEILRQSGVKDYVTSPTFGYVNSYKSPIGITFNHFDLYRIASVDEFIYAGFDELLYQTGSICLIEWPHIIHELLKLPKIGNTVCHIKIYHTDESFDSRFIDVDE